MVQTLRKFHTLYISKRRPVSLGLLFAQCCMVRRHTPRLSVITLLNINLGMAIILFFQCMCALLSPVNRTRRDVKWGLVAHTVAAFSFVTIYTTISLNILSISYIDNRGFPGINGALPPGPLGYIFSIYPKAISIARTVMFILNNWLADALLVGFPRESVSQVFDRGHSSSFIVVMSSML